MSQEQGRRALIWSTLERSPLAVEVARAADLDVHVAGSPVRGEAGALAAALDARPADDLRAEMASADVDLVLLLSPGAFGTHTAQEDAAAVLAAHARGVRIATVEPVPAAALDLASGPWRSAAAPHRPPELVRFLPLARLSRPFRDATEVLESFGPPRLVAVESWCRPVEASLGAMLFSTLELIHAILDEPETIDAAHVAMNSPAGLRAVAGDSLRDLHGEVSALLRFSDGRAASCVAGDGAGRWNRTATLIGSEGRLRIFDDGFEWIAPSGERIDHARVRERDASDPPSHAVAAIADAVHRLLDASIPDPGPANQTAVLAMAQATLLSTQTAQPESPTTIRRLIAGP